MRLKRLLKQPAEAQHLNQTAEGLWLAGIALKPFQESAHGLICVTGVDLHERKELVSRRQVRIERKSALKCCLGQLKIRRGMSAEFVEEPAASTQPSPGGGEAGVLSQAGPVQISRQVHRFQRTLS